MEYKDLLRIQDSIVAVWMSGAGGPSRVNIGTVDISGLNIGKNLELHPNISPQSNQNYPKIAGAGDTIAVVWQETGSGKRIIKLLASTTGIAGLLTAVVDTVNDVSFFNQQNPHIAYKNGAFHIVWTNETSKEVLYRSVSFGSVTGVKNEATPKMELTVIPNPSNGQFVVLANEACVGGVITIYNTLGENVWQENFATKKASINIDALDAGFYIINVQKDKTSTSQSLIIRNN